MNKNIDSLHMNPLGKVIRNEFVYVMKNNI